MTPLHVAAKAGQVEVVTLLLEFGAAVDPITSDTYSTPLHLACRHGFGAIVSLLLRASASREAQALGGITPLHVATRHGRMEIVRILLEDGVDVEVRWRVRGERIGRTHGWTDRVTRGGEIYERGVG